MKIPLGFELGTKCQIRIDIIDGMMYEEKVFNFYHYGSSVKAIEIGHNFENVNNDNVKIIDKYHLEFDLKLIDKNFYADEQEQDYLSNFLKYFYDPTNKWKNHNENQCFILHYFFTSYDLWEYMAQTVITKEPPKIVDIVDDDKTIGQYLEIKAITKEALTKTKNQRFWSLYRETTGNQEWGSSLSRITGWEKMEVGQVSAV